MAKTTRDRNRRALMIAALCAAVLLIVEYAVIPWVDYWKQQNVLLAEAGQQLNIAKEAQGETVYTRQLSGKVPVFEMPKDQDYQQLIFERKLNEQLQKASIKMIELPHYTAKPKSVTDANIKLLKMRCKGQGDFGNIAKLLAALNDENPYLVSVEEINIQHAKKKPNKMELKLIVSTFVK